MSIKWETQDKRKSLLKSFILSSKENYQEDEMEVRREEQEHLLEKHPSLHISWLEATKTRMKKRKNENSDPGNPKLSPWLYEKLQDCLKSRLKTWDSSQ
jgi:acetoin utilization deacetylase AcuC-like enzyme